MDNADSSRSWFCVLNNPSDCFSGDPESICDTVLNLWIDEHPTRSGAVAYCISADGLHHLHMVLEDTSKARFSALKKIYPKAHLEPTKGTKEQAEDYIDKQGKFKEKGEQILCKRQHGDIKGAQGQRKDFEVLQDLIDQGKTPNEIFDIDMRFRRYEKMVCDSFYRKKYLETPLKRDLKVVWHCGSSGSGKSYTYIDLCEKYGSENVYFVTDYSNPFDKYNGEKILFLDEFRGQVAFSSLLNTYLSCYRVQLPCRYSNRFACWSEVHFATVLPPELCYRKMVTENTSIDTIQQLYRRIDLIIYHFVDDDGKYRQFEQPMKDYFDYDSLKQSADDSLYTDVDILNLF